jgi:hypothetical protein
MRADQRKKLLDALRTGLSRESALAKSRLREADLSKRDRTAVATAEREGEAFVEGMLLEHARKGDATALKLFMERRRASDDEPHTLAELLQSMSAPARDQVRAVVESALERVRELNPVEREQQLLGIRKDLDGTPLPALEGSQEAEPVAGHPGTAPAPVATPVAPEAAEERLEADEIAARLEDAHVHEMFERQRRGGRPN